LHLTLFSLANVMAQLFGGEPLSPEIPARGIPMRFPFGLRNAAGDTHRLAATFFGLTPKDGEFVGITDYISESFHDLLAERVTTPRGSVSWRESPKGVSKMPTACKLP
jgi:hypothetical protein